MTSYEEDEAQGPRGWSPLAVALIATMVLLLGLGGALFGIYVANKNANATPTPDTTLPLGIPNQTTTPTTTPTQGPSSAPATTPGAPTDTFALPNLEGTDFQAARQMVRDLKLGWRLVFEGAGEDATVRTTDPSPGTMVKKGTTIKIIVKGAAPLATVPGVVGLSCSQAAHIIVDHGLYPAYPGGSKGVVTNQLPSASDPQTLHWNDEVQLICA